MLTMIFRIPHEIMEHFTGVFSQRILFLLPYCGFKIPLLIIFVSQSFPYFLVDDDDDDNNNNDDADADTLPNSVPSPSPMSWGTLLR